MEGRIHSIVPVTQSMAHRHQHPDHHAHDAPVGNIRVAFFLNLAFTAIEIAGGIYTGSLAILSDALHDLGDSLSLGLAWYFQRLSRKGRTRNYSYGYRRFSLLGALINSVILLAGSVLILSRAIPGLFDPQQADARGMLLLAVLGILVNGVAAYRLRKGSSLNEKVVSLHLLEDVLGWAAVLIGSLVMLIVHAPFIDPLLSVLISVYIFYNVIRNLGKSLKLILQGTPDGVSIEEISNKIANLSGVKEVHDCHIWSMDGEYHILTAHLRLDRDYPLSHQAELKRRVREALVEEPIHHLTLEFEAPQEKCLQSE